MARPKTEVPLVKKIAQAFKAVGKLPRNGKNTTRRYNWTRASDVLEAVRLELFSRDVLICPSEGVPEYVPIATTNGGEQITECRIAVTYTFRDALEKLEPMVCNGVGRDVEDKALYKAQTGAQKALLKRFGLMAEETDDPEWDATDSPDVAESPRGADKTVTHAQIRAFNDACAASNRSSEEIMTYLFHEHQVVGVQHLGRGKQFTQALVWAGNGSTRPKPQAAPALQGNLPLPKPVPPIEMRIGNKTVTVEPKTGSYAL